MSHPMTDRPFKFPRHECGLFLTHNEHRNYYETIEQMYDRDGINDGWVSEEQRLKAIREDNVWELQWYPDTPIGSYCLLACDLDVLLEEANKHD